jgi:murein L,D-transpeptidase YcbB/YkuD
VTIACAVVLLLALGASAANAQPLLRPGSRGALVTDWQRVLNAWLTTSGYAATRRVRREVGGRLIVDGIFGPSTEAATLRFQHEAHITADGVVGAETWVRWIEANVTCCGAGLPNLRPSARAATQAFFVRSCH